LRPGNGAHGYLLKDNTTPKNLLAAIKEVTTGGGHDFECRHEVIAHFEGQPKLHRLVLVVVLVFVLDFTRVFEDEDEDENEEEGTF